jgi:methionyl-tRNA synthetase
MTASDSVKTMRINHVTIHAELTVEVKIMADPVLVSVAWPYANAPIHVGNLTGAYLPADIFTRYQRLRGRDVLMVSGSDSHGTPITVRADAEGLTPLEVYQRYHASFLELFQKAGITYDLFTSTHTSNHFDVSQKMFLALNKNGCLYKETQAQWYSPAQQKFLPDRYVEGTCYICGYDNARSDQCDKCGSLLEPGKLINPRSKIDGSVPQLKDTEHYYLDLGKLQDKVVSFLEARQHYWRPNVVKQSLGQIQAEALHGRPITRDMEWGIPVPMEDADGKCLYVWFEAVIGYLSASIEWSEANGKVDAWRNWWTNPEARAYYFIGKDNIPFHAIIWPAELLGAQRTFDELMGAKDPQGFVLPYDVPANEFMNLEKQKISGSRNWAVYGLDFLSRFDPDPLRYYLTMNMPEAKDTDWDWDEFVARNNNELVATWGNLANRILSFTYKHWEGVVPEPGILQPIDNELLKTIEEGFQVVGEELENVHLRAALSEAVRLATEVNKYLDQTEPWKVIKTDRAAAARSAFTALKAIDSLKILFAPFLPFTCEKLNGFFGYDTQLFGDQVVDQVSDALGTHSVLRYDPAKATGRWQCSDLKPGTRLNQPMPLFIKLDPLVAAEERQRMGK